MSSTLSTVSALPSGSQFPDSNNNTTNTNNGGNGGGGGGGGGAAPLSVFVMQRRQDTSVLSSDIPSPTSTLTPSTTPPSAPSSSSTSSGGNGFFGGGGGGGNGPSIPYPFLSFALAAIALFVVVVSFILLRICVRNRRLRRYGIAPGDGPLDRFLTGQSTLGFRGLGGELEDTLTPPKLWEAQVVSPKSDPSSEKGGWEKLMPVAASLPTGLYNVTGAQSLSKDASQKQKEGDQPPLDDDAPVFGSVNVSVLIAMPSPPKDDGEELPELMLGTAAVPIYSRIPREPTTTALSPSTGTSYFQFPQQHAAPTTSHPTRAQLLALYKAARDAKDEKKQRQVAAAAKRDSDQPQEQQQASPSSATDAASAPAALATTAIVSSNPSAGPAEPLTLSGAAGASSSARWNTLSEGERNASPSTTIDTVTTAPVEAAPMHDRRGGDPLRA